MIQHVTAYSGAMHVARNKSSYVAKSGEERVYESVLLRRTFRDGKKVKHQTLANLSKLPPEAVDAIEATLKGQTLVPAGEAFTITRSLPHGQVAAVTAMARTLGLPALLGPAGRARDIAFALIVSRVVRYHPGRRPRRGRRVDRRGLRGHGLAGRPAGRHRKTVGGTASRSVGESGADGAVRPDQLVGDRALLRAGRPRLLPRRQKGPRADRVRHPHRCRGPTGGGARVRRQHRRPDRVPPDRHRDPRQVRAREAGARR